MKFLCGSLLLQTMTGRGYGGRPSTRGRRSTWRERVCFKCRRPGHIVRNCPVQPLPVPRLDKSQVPVDVQETEEELFTRLEKKYKADTLVTESPQPAPVPPVPDTKEDDGNESDDSNSSSSTSSSSSSGESCRSDCSRCLDERKSAKSLCGATFSIGGKYATPRLVNPGDVVQKYGLLLELDSAEQATEWIISRKI